MVASLFGLERGAALVMMVGVLTKVALMLLLVHIVKVAHTHFPDQQMAVQFQRADGGCLPVCEWFLIALQKASF